MELFICKYCNKQWKNNNSLHNHENQCKLNPDRLNKHYNYANSKIKQTKECPYCKKLISVSNYNKHINKHQTDPDYFIKIENRQQVLHEGLNCIYCGKYCKNKNSLAQHECRCPDNPDRIKSGGWNKGLTKGTDQRLHKLSDSVKQAHKSGKWDNVKWLNNSHPHSVETKQHLREVAIERGLGGYTKHIHSIDYNGVSLDSSWELLVAKDLDLHNINWVRPKRISYIDNKNKMHYYYPDFYLPDYNIYLDPKNPYLLDNDHSNMGYTDRQKLEWVMSQNNVKIIVLTARDLTWEKIKFLIESY